MNTEEFQLSRKITTQLLHWSQLSPSEEICGLIGAKNNSAMTCYPIDNNANHPETRFNLDEKQQISAFAKMRDNKETLFAIYHSHPTTAAIPSKTDIDLAAYPDAIYLIISLNTKGVLEMRGFKISNKSVQDITLSLIE
ncbi:MAG: M67 family metallopeptidase [Methylococcales symbiont of Hymedesmia sp. n. MRB-2018]|nr:MAG: M67 family metallopeptidase [Methylococcales symbiont of Hymedesmia sp. n. MRB-2018]